MKFSANLGFLYTDLPLPEAVHAAKADGFDALECHFPYDTPPADLKTALKTTGLRMLGMNTWPGDRSAGDFGLAALVGREGEARAEIERAFAYAAAAGIEAVHVMAGRTDGGAAAENCFRTNLDHACDFAEKQGITVLIEPINTRDVAGYHLSGTAHAAQIIDDLDRPELKIMFDCYHMQIMQGNLAHSIEKLLSKIGHIQIAAVPDRGEPNIGELDYAWLLRHISHIGYQGYIGAEYRPRTTTRDGLGWITKMR